MIDTRLRGKVAIVTGANHGIGAATAKALAREGVRVLITYLRLGDDYTSSREAIYKEKQALSADKVVEEIKASGGTAEAYETDLSMVENISQLFDKAEKVLGPVDILVNNAAYCDPDTFTPNEQSVEQKTGLSYSTITAETIDKHYAVNTRANALMIEEFAKRQKNRGANWDTRGCGGCNCLSGFRASQVVDWSKTFCRRG